MPRGIGWWWGITLDWPEWQLNAFVDQQTRETLVQMLQETDPNGVWTDEQAKIEFGHVTSLETARAQMKTFWKEGQPVEDKVIKPVPVESVTNDMMKNFFRAYWQECGSKEEDFMIEEYVNSAIGRFRFAMDDRQHYCDGARWDIMTYKVVNGANIPTGVWPNVKVRFKVADPMDGTPYEKRLFTFVVYGNSIATKEMHKKVKPAVSALVDKLKERFPVVAEE